MSTTDRDPDESLRGALKRAFPGLSSDESGYLLGAIRAGKVVFPTEEIVLEKAAIRDTEALEKWLSGTGEWRERLLAAVTPDAHRLRWAPEHEFMFTLAA